MSNLKKTILIIIGIGLLILMFWLLFFGQNKNNNVGQEKIDNPTLITTPTITPFYSNDQTDEENEQSRKEAIDYLSTHPLWESLPYETSQFKISHYIKEMTLVVYVSKSENQEEIKELVNKWIVNKGINPPNHNIEFRFKD